MDWPTAFSIVGCVWGVVFLVGHYTQFKRYRMDEIVRTVIKLEKEMKEIQEERNEHS